MDDGIEARLEALERAVTGDESDLTAIADEAQAMDRLSEVESQLEELDDRVSELEAATQALRGYVGNIRSVNSEVEKRADIALAKVEALETSLDIDDLETQMTGASTESKPKSDDCGSHTSQEPRREPTANHHRGEKIAGHTHEHPHQHEVSGPSHCKACGRPELDQSERLSPQQETRNERPSESGPANDEIQSGQPEQSGQSEHQSPAAGGRSVSRPTNGDSPLTNSIEDGHHDGPSAADATVSSNNDSLVPSTTSPTASENGDAGTLQRIRNML